MFSFRVVVLVLLAEVSPLLVQGASSLADWQGFGHGERAMCGPGQVLVGVCGSGKNTDCHLNGQSYSHLIRCANVVSNTFHWHNSSEVGDWIGANQFTYASCDESSMAVGRCSGGQHPDCADSKYHEIICAKAPSPRVVLDITQTQVICKGYGEIAQCPVGMVITKECGAGQEGSDCRRDICSGAGNVFTGIECTALRGYEYDGTSEPSVAKPAEFIIEGCKKELFTNEGKEPITRVITNTVTVTTEVEKNYESSQSSSESLSQKFDISQKISADVGFPEVGASVSTETTAGFSRTFETKFDTSSTYRERLESKKVEEGKIEQTVSFAPGVWVILSWGGLVRGYGGYNSKFKEYAPGQIEDVVVDEDSVITTSDAADDTFFLVLNADKYDDKVKVINCETLADQFLEGTGIFESFSLDQLSLFSYQDDATPLSSAPTAVPTKAPVTDDLPTDPIDDLASSGPSILGRGSIHQSALFLAMPLVFFLIG